MSVERTSWMSPGEPLDNPLDPVEQLSKELTDEDRKLIDWVADQIVSRRLTAPALFLLESSKPLNFVSSQLLVVLSPVLVTLMPRVPYDRLVSLLEKRSFIELLLRAIEGREDDHLARKKAEKNTGKAGIQAEGTEHPT